MDTVVNIKKGWNRLIGEDSGCSMENKAFNFVCLISFPLLIFIGIVDYCISLVPMTNIVVVLLAIVTVLFYLSRYKKIYNPGIFIYAITSYLALIYNYFENSGIAGPTLILFILTFHLQISVGRRKLYPLWICLHAICGLGLLYLEYNHPQWFPNTYESRKEMFYDVASNFVIAIAFIYGITNYLRRSFNSERLLAEQRAFAIQEQNNRITEQNRLLEQVNEEKNKLFSIVSHDLKAPIDSISGYLELISQDLIQGEEKTKIEAELLARTKYTSDLLVNLLTWAKTQMDGVTVNLAQANLKEIVDSMVANKMSTATTKGVKLSLEADDDIKVICDTDMVLIVLRNLINNAIKFTASGGEVSITVTRKDKTAEVAVKDTGMGISPEQQADVFSPRIKSSFGTNKEKGTGLGLIMCKTFMDYQHGSIWFESKPKLGTIFYISLPLAAASK